MAKPTPTKEDQPFIYQLGQDVAKLGFEVEQLKSKTVKAMRVVVPKIPDGYTGGDLEAKVMLPVEYQHMICIKSRDGQIDLLQTGETLDVIAEYKDYEFYLAPVYKLDSEPVSANFAPDTLAEIETIKRNQAIYKYLAKYLTDNYLTLVRNSYKGNGQVYVNQNGLDALLDKPFETDLIGVDLPLGDYEEAKSAIKTELDNINAGRVDLNSASNFAIERYYKYVDA
jgi:hypothetical protein|nr:MAG TPA: hypothetical protein [Caudoviricetes sp.]